MPTFDFSCNACSTAFEASIPFGSKEFPPCPSCGSTEIVKKISPPLGIHFKGEGFYRTDSQKKSSQPAEGGEKKTEEKKSDTQEVKAAEPPKDTSAAKKE